MILISRTHLRKSSFQSFCSNLHYISYSKMKQFFPFSITHTVCSSIKKDFKGQRSTKTPPHLTASHRLPLDSPTEKAGLAEWQAVTSPRDRSFQVCLRKTWQHIKNKNRVWLFLLNTQTKDFITVFRLQNFHTFIEE